MRSDVPLMPMVRPRLRLGQGGKCLRQVFFFAPLGIETVENKKASSGGYNCAVPDVIRTFTIRDFKPEDFETLWTIDQKCFPPEIAYSREELAHYIHKRGAITLVAENPGSSELAGFIVAQGGSAGHIITIDVMADARRAGLGSQMLRAAEERLEAAGSHAVGLETAVDNLGALAFYKRHGYEVIRTWPRYYSNGVDALVLKKELSRKQL